MKFTKELKQGKLDRIITILKDNADYVRNELSIDCLSGNTKSDYGLESTENVSCHGYDRFARELIEQNPNGLVLDCGAGQKSEYYENVVNLEITNYDSTDVIALGEQLPFKDSVFDGIMSLNVLEHVKDPFLCAQEISRVLKKNGKLYCVAPFLCPYHDYPDHYYNMTHSGLLTLFERHLKIEKQEVIASGLPIFSLTWILNSWAAGLDEKTKSSFLNMRVQDLLANPVSYLEMPFVKNLSKEKNFELAATTAIWATKNQ
jgi:SAM-dependent methyltransferase